MPWGQPRQPSLLSQAGPHEAILSIASLHGCWWLTTWYL
jgi:hypothetical protein